MNRAISFLQGAFFGALLGATLAILFAPSSGEKLRQDIQSRAEQIRADVQQAAEERRAELEQQLADLRARQTG